jgi:Family of unknown function (DUF5317)
VLLPLVALLAVLTVPVFGGDIGRLARLRLRVWWLLSASLTVQIVIISVWPDGPSGLYRVLHLASYAGAFVFMWLNRRLRGFWLVGLGALSNFVAIAANMGVMPASPSALRTAGRPVVEGLFTNSTTVADARLPFLGDVFAMPAWIPLANVFSLGDIAIALGVILVVHGACRRIEATRDVNIATQAS